MEEHKLLTGMLLVALVVSVVGTVITVDRLGALGGVGLTGAATGVGSGDLNITQDITISLPDSAIDFGNGIVDASAGYAQLASNAGLVASGSWANSSDNITIRNDGNVGVNITVQSNKQSGNDTTDSFICQGDIGGCGVDYEDGGQDTALQYLFSGANKETNACALIADSTDFTLINTDYEFCDCLKTGSDEDEVMFSLNVGVPADAQGQKTSTITFTSTAAAAAGQC